MAKQPRDLADKNIDGTYPPELRDMGDLASHAWGLYANAEDVETRARKSADGTFPAMRQIAADAYALWRLIEATCGPIVEAFEREQDARDTEEVEAKDAEAEDAEEYGRIHGIGGVYVGTTSDGKYRVFVPSDALEAEHRDNPQEDWPDADDWAADFNDRGEATLVPITR